MVDAGYWALVGARPLVRQSRAAKATVGVHLCTSPAGWQAIEDRLLDNRGRLWLP